MQKTFNIRALTCFVILFLCSLDLAAQLHDWIRTNPGGGGAFSTVKAGPSGIVIAGSDLSGAYRSFDRGLSWDVIGASRGLTKTHISGMGFDPEDENIIYLGTTQGIFLSHNSGDTFSRVLDFGYVNDLVAAPSNPSTVYASFHSAWNTTIASIYKSTNQGVDWFKVSDDFPTLRILKIEVHPTDENTLYFLSGKGRGACGPTELHRSTDGGINWENIGGPLGTILDFKIHPEDDSVVYATNMHADCSAPYYYTDRLGSLFRSEDGGNSWQEMSSRTGIIWLDPFDNEAVRLIDPRNTEDWNPRSGTWTSLDYGQTWTKTGDNILWEKGFQESAYGTTFDGLCKCIGSDMSNPNHLYWVDSQWVYGTFNQGVHFEHLNTNEVEPGWWQSRGFDNVNMMDMEINATDPNIIFAAYFDIGLWRSLDHGESWQSCNQIEFTGSWRGEGGNTISVVSDPVQPNVVWATMSQHQKGNQPTFLVKSEDTGAKGSWSLSNTGLPEKSVMGISIDPSSPIENRSLFVTAEGSVYHSNDNGNNWEQVLIDSSLWFTAVDQFDGNLVYAGGGSGFWKSADGGSSWQETGLPEMRGTTEFWGWGKGRGVFDIICSSHQTGIVYVTAFGEEKGLYKSVDKGESWTKLLSDDFMRKVAESPNDASIIYATSSRAMTSGGYIGESRGVLFSNDGGESFVESNDGMAWPFAHTVNLDIENWVFIGSPGTGFQKAMVPETTSVQTNVGKKPVTVYPNPVDNFITISGKLTDSHIKIYNQVGQLITDYEQVTLPLTIDLSCFKTGLYFLVVQSGLNSGIRVTKFIKH